MTLLDTAGIRADTRGDAVEAIGVERSLAAANGADAVILVVDARDGWADEDREVWESLATRQRRFSPRTDRADDGASMDDDGARAHERDEFENARARLYAARGGLERFEAEAETRTETNGDERALRLEASFADAVCAPGSDPAPTERRVPTLLALNKVDVATGEAAGAPRKNTGNVPRDVLDALDAVVETSATTRLGLEELESALAAAIGAGAIDPEGAQWAANQRQAEALRVAEAALERLEETVAGGLPVDFWTIELREAAAALGEITGEDVTEDVLDVVFTKFCIGK